MANRRPSSWLTLAGGRGAREPGPVWQRLPVFTTVEGPPVGWALVPADHGTQADALWQVDKPRLWLALRWCRRAEDAPPGAEALVLLASSHLYRLDAGPAPAPIVGEIIDGGALLAAARPLLGQLPRGNPQAL